MSDRITLSLDNEAAHLQEQLEKDIENIYGGKSAFYRTCLRQYDQKNRLEAKIEMINQELEDLNAQEEELKLHRQALKQKLDEVTVEKQEEIDAVDVPQKFWDKAINAIFIRDGRDTVEEQFNQYFDGLHREFCKRYRQVEADEFKELLVENAREEVKESRVEKIQSSKKVKNK